MDQGSAPKMAPEEATVNMPDPKEEFPPAIDRISSVAWHKAKATAAEVSIKKNFKFAMKTLRYNPNRPLQALFAFHGTALEMLITRIDFWIFLGLNIMFNLAYALTGGKAVNEKPTHKDWPKLTYVALGASGGLITFFLVFYSTSAYSRFYQLYGLVRSAETAVDNLITPVRTVLADGVSASAAASRKTIIRYIVAAHALAMAHLKPYREVGVHEWAYEFLEDYQTLTPEEITELRALPRARAPHEELVDRIVALLWAQVRDTKVIPPPVFTGTFLSPTNQFKNSFLALEQQLEYPIPFCYFHLLNLVTVLYLLTASYSFVFLTPYWSILSYLILLLSFLGLRELSCALADPFGTDATDFPSFRYVLHLHEKFMGTLDLPDFELTNIKTD